MNDFQIKGSEDYGKLCCFRDDEGNEEYGHLSLFMKANSNNPNERDMYFRQEDGKAYRMAWKVDEEDVLTPDEEVIHEQNKTIERLQEQLRIATNALKQYSRGDNWLDAGCRGQVFLPTRRGYSIADKALDEMEDVK